MTGSRYKIVVVTICLNQPYWEYLGKMVDSAKKFFLKGHEVDYFSWSDMPADQLPGIKVFPTQPFTWPMPTLHRYHLFLQQEELLKEYDFIFYLDADMLFVSRVGNEVLGDILIAQHPMYALSRGFIPPYEPNPESTAYIPRLGRIVTENNKKRLDPIYAAGGFQGGRADKFIKAMKEMKEMIDTDFAKNSYIAIWNDESYWQKWLFDNSNKGIILDDWVALSPSYVYPDTLNRPYYQRVWGKNYVPKLLAVTKKHTLVPIDANKLIV